jgi:hypothetical protein
MTPRLSAVFLLLLGSVALGGPTPAPKAETRTDTGPHAVDFSPLAGADPDGGRWQMRLAVRAVCGETFTLDFAGVGRPGAADHWVFWVPQCVPAGWDFEADAKGSKVTFKGCRGSPVRSVEVSVKGLDEKYKPSVTKPGKK